MPPRTLKPCHLIAQKRAWQGGGSIQDSGNETRCRPYLEEAQPAEHSLPDNSSRQGRARLPSTAAIKKVAMKKVQVLSGGGGTACRTVAPKQGVEEESTAFYVKA
eukprot:546051-Pelagomonas_calceolata.AAC.3